MKIIISAGDGTKREITGAFSVCGSLDDLRTVARELSSVVDNDDRPFSYGWVDIIPDRPKVQANTPPMPWSGM